MPEVVAFVPPTGVHRKDALVSWLLLFGGFVFVIGWFVGLAMLWRSDTWGRRDKLLGTFVLPGGLLGVVILLSRPTASTGCSSGGAPGVRTITHCTTTGFTLPPTLSVPLMLFLFIAPICTAIHLERTRNRV